MYSHQEIRRFGHGVDETHDDVYLGRVIACDSLEEVLGDGGKRSDGVERSGRGIHDTEIRNYRAVEDGVAWIFFWEGGNHAAARFKG